MEPIELGITYMVSNLALRPTRDLLLMDFCESKTISFPPRGSRLTPAHHYSAFKFKIYASNAFRYSRDLFGIPPEDFMMSICLSPLRKLSNSGGSICFTNDDKFIIKTVQHKERVFLQRFLPGYYLYLTQNPRSLLPKFCGLFQCDNHFNRLIEMNNLLPSNVQMHCIYDLKGSTYKRKANKTEHNKKSPTYKDLDFIEQHRCGIFLEANTYIALMKTIQRDCHMLESFKIINYSLQVGVYNLDLAVKEELAKKMTPPQSPYEVEDNFDAYELDRESSGLISLSRQSLLTSFTAMENVQAESLDENNLPSGGIPARNEKGERLLLFINIINILQSYRLKEKLERTIKSIFHDGNEISVCQPSFYAQRFQDFIAKDVFRKIPIPLDETLDNVENETKNDKGSIETGQDSDQNLTFQSSNSDAMHHQILVRKCSFELV